jgi:hypothetical protein
MFRKLRNYLQSNRFKNKLYTVGTLSLMSYAAYLALTINKPMFKPTHAEKNGQDDYDKY